MVLFWKRRSTNGLKVKVSELKAKRVLEDITQQLTTSLRLGSLWKSVVMINPISFCCFVDFRKAFDMVPRNNLWNRLEELKVPFELRAATIRLYDNFIAKFKSNEGWSKDIKCNIGVKQGFPLSPTLFGIYID